MDLTSFKCLLPEPGRISLMLCCWPFGNVKRRVKGEGSDLPRTGGRARMNHLCDKGLPVTEKRFDILRGSFLGYHLGTNGLNFLVQGGLACFSTYLLYSPQETALIFVVIHAHHTHSSCCDS